MVRQDASEAPCYTDHSTTEIAHSIIDLLVQGAQNPQLSTSPSTPASPHPARNPHAAAATVPPLPAPYKPDQLTRLKIVMREAERQPRLRESMGESMEAEGAFLGRNEGTVRFMFAPPGIADDGYQ